MDIDIEGESEDTRVAAVVTCVICRKTADLAGPPSEAPSTSGVRVGGRGRKGRGRAAASAPGSKLTSSPDGVSNGSNVVVDIFNKFCKELLSISVSIDNPIGIDGGGLSVCQDCSEKMNTATDTKLRMEVVEARVRKLQLEVVREMKELQIYMDLLGFQLRRLEDCVKESDEEELLKRWGDKDGVGRKAGQRRGRSKVIQRRRDGQGQDQDAGHAEKKWDIFMVRKCISNVTRDLFSFRDELSSKLACRRGPEQAKSATRPKTKAIPVPGAKTGTIHAEVEPSEDYNYDLESAGPGSVDLSRNASPPYQDPDSDLDEDVVGVNDDDIPDPANSHEDEEPSTNEDDDVVMDFDGEYLLAPEANSNHSSGPADVSNDDEEPDQWKTRSRPRRRRTQILIKRIKLESVMLSDNEEEQDEDFNDKGDNFDESPHDMNMTYEEDDIDDDGDDNYEPSSSLKSKSRGSVRQKRKLMKPPATSLEKLDMRGMPEFKKFLLRNLLVTRNYGSANDDKNQSGEEEVEAEDEVEEAVGADAEVSQENPSSIENYLKQLNSDLKSSPIQYSESSGTFSFKGVDIQISTENKSLICSECDHSVKVKWPAPDAKQGYEAKRRIKRHILYRHLDVLKCPTCDTKYPTPDRFRDHILRHHKKGESPNLTMTIPSTRSSPKSKSNGFPCQLCDKTLSSKVDLERHLWGHKTEEEKASAFYEDKEQIVCMGCGKLIDKHYIRRHREMTCLPEEVPRLKCPHCEKTFKNRITVSRHVETMHPSWGRGKGKQLFKCKVCGKELKTLKEFNCHMKVHAI